jgi:hypothetical protein
MASKRKTRRTRRSSRQLPVGRAAQMHRVTYRGATLFLTYHGRKSYIVDVYRNGLIGTVMGSSPELAVAEGRKLVRDKS